MPSEGLFGSIFGSDAFDDAFGDAAWLRAMLRVEAELAGAGAELGIVPSDAADAITAACESVDFTPDAIGAAAADSGNPVIPLVDALRARVSEEHAPFVHYGATSQDILDTATMLLLHDALPLVTASLDRIAMACDQLADTYRDTLMVGRTLLQPAVPMTFGLKAAGWLVAALDARDDLLAVTTHALAVQFGGSAGTLAGLDGRGVELLELLSRRLDLPTPTLPWHAARGRIARIGGALAVVAGVVAKIALDVELLAQSEVAEAHEPRAPGRGRSSSMPYKRNPIGCVIARANALRVNAAAGVLFAALAHEHERAGGPWHAEWEALRTALTLTGAAAVRVAEVVEGLEVDPARMRSNLDDAAVTGTRDPDVGSAAELVDRALARHRASG